MGTRTMPRPRSARSRPPRSDREARRGNNPYSEGRATSMSEPLLDTIVTQLESCGWTVERGVPHDSRVADRWKLSCDSGVCYLEVIGEPAVMCSVCREPDNQSTQMAVMLRMGPELAEEGNQRMDNFLKGVDRFRTV